VSLRNTSPVPKTTLHRQEAFAALRPGWHAFTYGCNPAPGVAGGVNVARLALHLATLAAGNGVTYPAAGYETWLSCAGFDEVQMISGLPSEYGPTSGYKPASADGLK
jgi:hypothetical protein